MKMLSKFIFGALAGLGLVSAAHSGSYGPGNPATLNAVPAGFTLCAGNGKVCKVPAGATGYVVYGKGSKFNTAQGTGNFSCLPKGFVKFPSASTPQDLGVDDPVPGGDKDCYLMASGGGTQPAAPVAPPPPAAPVATAAGKLVASVPSGAVVCASDGKVCDAVGDWSGVYGVPGKFAPIAGKDRFTCLPKGFVKAPSVSTPVDTGVDDPAPGVGKTCYILGKIAPPPTTTSTHSSAASAPSCQTAWDANGIKPNANCIYRTQSGKDYGSACPSEVTCSCQCAANKSKNCMFSGKTIRQPECRPGS